MDESGGMSCLWLTFLPLAYKAAVVFFSLFQLRFALSPQPVNLQPGCSDIPSLLFNATYLCRLAAPLCYNYLNLLHEKYRAEAMQHLTGGHTINTALVQSLGDKTDVVPLLGEDYFNEYGPIAIVLLCGCTYLNLGST